MAIGGLDANEVRIAPNGAIYVADAGTAAPTDLSTALTSSWTNLGYASEDGVSLSNDISTNEIKGWQSAVSLKRGLEDVAVEVSFSLLQTNKEVVSFYWAGSTWANGAAGVATLTIPSNPSISSMEHALVVEYVDDAGDTQRLYFGRGMVTEREEITLKRDDAVMYGVTFSAFDNNGELGRMLSNSLDLYSS